MNSPSIAIVDYQMGNLRSVQKAFEHVGYHAEVTSVPDVIESAAKVILPGVGAFPDAIRELRNRELIAPIQESIRAGKPFLGICLGLQLLFEVGLEGGEHQGMGIIPGRVERFSPSIGLKIPHMGWNQVNIEKTDSPLLNGIDPLAYFYFVHSYHAVPADPALVAARTDYGKPVVAMAGRGHVYATQFHPEKSQAHGLQILKNFAALN